MLKQLMLRKRLEQKRTEFAALGEKREAINKRSIDAEAAIGEAKTDEEMAVLDAEIEAISTESDALEADKSKLEGEIEEIEKELEVLRSNEPKAAEPKAEERKQTTEGETRMSKFKFFRSMDQAARNEIITREDVKDFALRVRSLITEKRSITGSDLLIPEVMLDLLRDNLSRYSKLVGKINLKRVKGKARQRITGAVPEGVWTEAVGILNELALSFSQIEVDGYKVGGFIPVPNSTIEDSDINLMDEIMDMLGQAIGYAVDKAIVFGTGTKMPVGIATRLAETSEPSYWGDNEKAWTDLHSTNALKFDPTSMTAEAFFATLILNLGVAKPDYSSGELFWVMNRATKMKIVSKAVTLNAAGAIVAGVSNTMPVVGGEIIELEFMSDNDIIGGFGSLYLLAERAGASLAVSEHVKFIEDQTVFKGTARYDGRPVFGEGFVAVNIANAAPTLTKSFATDSANF